MWQEGGNLLFAERYNEGPHNSNYLMTALAVTVEKEETL